MLWFNLPWILKFSHFELFTIFPFLRHSCIGNDNGRNHIKERLQKVWYHSLYILITEVSLLYLSHIVILVENDLTVWVDFLFMVIYTIALTNSLQIYTKLESTLNMICVTDLGWTLLRNILLRVVFSSMNIKFLNSESIAFVPCNFSIYCLLMWRPWYYIKAQVWRFHRIAWYT